MSNALTPEDVQDSVFISEYVRLEGTDDAAAVTAYRKAKIFNPLFPLNVAAEMQLNRPEIQAAIAEARKSFVPRLRDDRSRESLMTDLDEVFESALRTKDHGACVNAKRLQAQVQGFLDQNVNITHKLDLVQMSDDQLLKIAMRTPVVVEGEAIDVTPRQMRGIGQLDTEADK